MNAQEWSPLVREHSAWIWRTIHRLVPNRADAADCFQETFAAAWEVAARGPVKNWGGMLQRLATRKGLDHLRRRHSRNHPLQLETPDVARTLEEPPDLAIAEELAEVLTKALADLPGQQGEIYCLRHLNELSYEAIGETMGMTPNAVGVQLHRATQRLRETLAPLLEQHDMR